MKRLVGLFTTLLAAVFFFGPTSAGDDGKKGRDIDVIFRKLDSNNDGRLTKDEFLKIADKFRDKDKARRQLGQTYDRLDPDQKGLTREQFRSFVEVNKKRDDNPKSGM
jgi:Ca2+-binding EF-hand superfamily protein